MQSDTLCFGLIMSFVFYYNACFHRVVRKITRQPKVIEFRMSSRITAFFFWVLLITWFQLFYCPNFLTVGRFCLFLCTKTDSINENAADKSAQITMSFGLIKVTHRHRVCNDNRESDVGLLLFSSSPSWLLVPVSSTHKAPAPLFYSLRSVSAPQNCCFRTLLLQAAWPLLTLFH